MQINREKTESLKLQLCFTKSPFIEEKCDFCHIFWRQRVISDREISYLCNMNRKILTYGGYKIKEEYYADKRSSNT